MPKAAGPRAMNWNAWHLFSFKSWLSWIICPHNRKLTPGQQMLDRKGTKCDGINQESSQLPWPLLRRPNENWSVNCSLRNQSQLWKAEEPLQREFKAFHVGAEEVHSHPETLRAGEWSQLFFRRVNYTVQWQGIKALFLKLQAIAANWAEWHWSLSYILVGFCHWIWFYNARSAVATK